MFNDRHLNPEDILEDAIPPVPFAVILAACAYVNLKYDAPYYKVREAEQRLRDSVHVLRSWTYDMNDHLNKKVRH